jgi:diguanylate cyclase (GGDEF)-like protein
MAVQAASDQEMRAAVKALEQALYNHEQWSEALHTTLVCRLAADERDLAADAHRRCRFGEWYYADGIAAFGGHTGFQQIAGAHEEMHHHAAGLLQASAAGRAIAARSYQDFIAAMRRMRLEIATLKREIEDTLYNLDPLTGTPSRIGMLTKLREEQALAGRRLHVCTLAMMDIDHFKAVNDTHGHMVGDKVLSAIARYAMDNLRPYDKVFRYGGEEFLLCLPDSDTAGGREVVERLREGIARLEHRNAGTFHVTVSLGLATLDPELPVEQSIDRADKALYAAKRAGRNRTMIWEGTLDAAPAS